LWIYGCGGVALFLPITGNAAESNRVSIADAGAAGDGVTLNTAVIQKAIDQLATNGGGTLVIPQGQFLTGAIF